jgi:hypothetical protein
MKTNIILACALATILPLTAQIRNNFQIKKQGGNSKAEANADTRVDVSGDQTHVERKSVTITSQNGRTVRKTTTFKNGREQTTTEILDGDGNVIGVEGGPGDAPRDGQDPQQADKDRGPWLGVRVEEASPALRDQLGLGEGQGVVINAAAPDGPAAKSGLRVNDILLKLDETPLGTAQDLRDALDGHQPGDRVTLTYLRRGKEDQAGVILEEDPDRREARGDANDNNRNQGAMKIEIGGNGGGNFKALLDDPNIPEDFKKTIRKMMKGFPDINAGGGANGGNGGMKIEIQGNGINGMDAVLDNPQVPEEFKKTVREMLDRVRGDDPDRGDGEDL